VNNSQHTLSDVLYLLSLEDDKPTAALIAEYRQRFPEFAKELTDFAVELAIDAVGTNVPELDAEELTGVPNNLVLQSISDFQNARFNIQKAKVEEARSSASPATSVGARNPFIDLSKEQFAELTRALDVNSVFVSKLSGRLIVPGTIPAGFTDIVSKQMNVSTDMMIAHFCAERTYSAPGSFYKALDQPKVQPQETFEEAVRRSGLSGEQQARLLKF